jgi:hypothetical protein
MVFMLTLYLNAKSGTALNQLTHVLKSLIDVIKQALGDFKGKSNLFNQDNLRDNFTAVSLIVDACIMGVGAEGGALPSRLITSEEGTHLLAEALRKGVKYQSSDMLSSSTSRSKA